MPPTKHVTLTLIAIRQILVLVVPDRLRPPPPAPCHIMCVQRLLNQAPAPICVTSQEWHLTWPAGHGRDHAALSGAPRPPPARLVARLLSAVDFRPAVLELLNPRFPPDVRQAAAAALRVAEMGHAAAFAVVTRPRATPPRCSVAKCPGKPETVHAMMGCCPLTIP